MSSPPLRTGPNVESLDRDQGTVPAASSPPSPEPGKPEPGPAERLAYSIDEAARLTGLSRDLLYDQMRLGNLTYVKVGRRRLYHPPAPPPVPRRRPYIGNLRLCGFTEQ